ncbi:hypothetical protein Ahy_A07g033094 isoform B [Arachis hypogaea]|uniref:Uncharacterized protein n=1 Tax=Arachis hypogaea TaxID=3818 RepID=A0A445C8B1_ARAHY|nr:hypothetical protein Ahy_A07g033094 isoform B [Arachis hypogaea]
MKGAINLAFGYQLHWTKHHWDWDSEWCSTAWISAYGTTQAKSLNSRMQKFIVLKCLLFNMDSPKFENTIFSLGPNSNCTLKFQLANKDSQI